MPPVVPFLAALGSGIAASVGIGLGAMGIATGVAIAIGASAIGLVTYSAMRGSKLRDSGGDSGGPAGQQLLVRSTTEFRKIAYGECAVGGPLFFMNTSGTRNESLWIGEVLTGHEIDSFQGVYLDDKFVPVADIDVAGDGSVDADTNSHGFGPITSTPVLYLRGHLGATGQTVDSALDTAFTEWTSNHRLRGDAYLVARMEQFVGAETVWQGGAPSNISALIRGKKVYDPRLDGTFVGAVYGAGVGAHRLATPSTWTYSSNPALCTADYLIDSDLGAGFDSARIDYDSVAVAAGQCDTLVAIPTATTQKRFTCNGTLSCGDTHRDNVEKLISSMGGQLRYYNGLWRITAGMWPSSSSFTLTEAHLIGPITYRKSPERTERYNAVRGEFFDQDRLHKVTQYLSVEDASLETSRDDGLTLWKELDLSLTNDEYTAQRLAIRMLAQAGQAGVCIFPTGYNGLNIAPGDRGTVTIAELGWSGKNFRCVGLRHVDMVGVELVLKEDDSTAYDDPVEADYGTRTAAGVISPPKPYGMDPHVGDSVISDPFFDRGVGFGSGGTVAQNMAYFWVAFATGTTTIAYVRTGGVYGGIAQVAHIAGGGDQFSLTSIPRRSALFITGEKFRVNIRLRKTTNVTTFATAFIRITIGSTDDTGNDGAPPTELVVFDIVAATMNGWTNNQWQEIEGESTAPQRSKALTQTSHVYIRAISNAWDVSCGIEIDAFNCARIKT